VSSLNEVSFAGLDARLRAAVQAVAERDPNPLDPYRGLYVSDEQALALAATIPAQPLDLRLQEAADRLGLGGLESEVLAACAAPLLSPTYGRLYAYLHDDVSRKLPSPRLLARLLGGDDVPAAQVLASFDARAPLRAHGAIRLLDEDSTMPLPDRAAALAAPLAAFLLGARLDDVEADRSLVRVDPPRHDVGRAETLARLRAILDAGSALPLVVVGHDAAAVLAAALEEPVLIARAAGVLERGRLADAVVTARLEGRRLCFQGVEELTGADADASAAVIAEHGRPPILLARSATDVAAFGARTLMVVDVPLPNHHERRAAWAAFAGTDQVDDVAAKFRLSLGQIEEAAGVAWLAAAARHAPVPAPDDLDVGARRASSTRLGELAIRLEPSFAWDDLVLPERQQSVLKSISGYLRHRDLVLSDWGYDRTVARTQGLKVLFAGESGTGKTMAAQILARELGLDLFRIDLAAVVSKYIGETEKNLDAIFQAAEGSNAILFFDEADALFGKRSEVRDSHDRYANLEVAYLLQKMECYEGGVILATNFRHNIDEAFLRRLDFVIDFPFPSEDDRRRIWRLLLPDAAPVADDVDVDFLATQFKLSGGSIRNASLMAAFLAADDGHRIDMRHLVRAVALEYGKLGRLTLETDFERFHGMVRE
jgi:SpoVK/Ycf46/Vps4 family AAA+-type ATPase